MDSTTDSAQLDIEIEKAYSLALSGQLEEAKQAYSNLLERHPDDPRILGTLGAIFLRLGNLVKARQLIEESLRFDPNQTKPLVNLSAILFNLGELAGALDAIDRVIALGEQSADAWNNRGIILNAQGRTGEALIDLDKALAIDPQNIDALYNKGSVLQKMGSQQEAAAAYNKIIELAPNHARARYSMAILLANGAKHAQAIAVLSQLISEHPDFTDALLQRSRIFSDTGQVSEALADAESVIELTPDNSGAFFQKGCILMLCDDPENALPCFVRACELAPNDPYSLLAMGVARFKLKDNQGALAAFDAALGLSQDIPEAFNNKGQVLQELKQFPAAIEHYEHALALRPGYTDAIFNQANALREQGKHDESLALYKTLLEQAPEHVGWKNMGATLELLFKREEALEAYKQAIVVDPKDADAHVNAAGVLTKLNKPEQALLYANKALKLDPKHVNALQIRALILLLLDAIDHARVDAEEAARLEPRHALANYVLGIILEKQKLPSEALTHFDMALEENADIDFLLGRAAHIRADMSDWAGFDENIAQLLERIDHHKPACQSFELHSKIDDPIYHRKCSEIYFDFMHRTSEPAKPPTPAANERIHIAYFSSDIGDHPVTTLMAGVFEAHDREKFEVTVFSLVNHSGETRNRIFHASERFINAEFMTDEEVVALARSLNVDIAIDLNGYTGTSRTGIFSRRVAPLQVNYIGFLGTMGSDCHDYIIGDPVIAPFSNQDHFSEKIIHLPCYQANDDKLVIPDTRKTRKDYDLPEEAFVFCSFNGNYKITPQMFSAWMEILRQTPDSVLWLYCKQYAIDNLRLAAKAHGIDDSRLIFAKQVMLPEHLARQRLGDLFLDTYPYNAGATASNALYSGLPLITYLGRSFCSRYGASLLTALDLPELITHSIEDYIALSVHLATHADDYRELKEKLARNLKTRPLFNTEEFTRNLERAYCAIQSRHRQGLPTEHVSPDAGSR